MQAVQNPCLDSDKSVFQSGDQNLAEILFFESDFDPDLRTVVKRWDGLSLEIRKAIVRMVSDRR